jgi:hypothetical protein
MWEQIGEEPRGDMPATDTSSESMVRCLHCAADTVSPVEWDEHTPTSWQVLMRCGSCGLWREGVFTDAECEIFDRQLDEQQAQIRAACERLEQERLDLEVEQFRLALEADAVLPDDFCV